MEEKLLKAIDELFATEKKYNREKVVEQLKNKEMVTILKTIHAEKPTKLFEVLLNLADLKIYYVVNDEIVNKVNFTNTNEIIEFIKKSSITELLNDENFKRKESKIIGIPLC